MLLDGYQYTRLCNEKTRDGIGIHIHRSSEGWLISISRRIHCNSLVSITTMATENQFTLSPDQNDFISYLVVSGNTSNLKRANQSSTIINSDPPEHPLDNDHSSLKYQWIKKTVVPARKKSYKSFCNGGIRSEWPTKYKLKAGYNPGDWLRGDVDIIRPLTNSEYKEQSVAGSSTSSTTTTTPPPSPTSSTTNMAPNKTPRFDTKDMKSAIDKVDKFDNIGEEQAGTYYLKCSIEEYITGKVNVSRKSALVLFYDMNLYVQLTALFNLPLLTALTYHMY